MNNHLVTVEWLEQHLNDENIVILDATMAQSVNVAGSHSREIIKSARRFDFSSSVVDKNSPIPNMMPTAEAFQKEARKLGVSSQSKVVVYDAQGLFSAARAWYMFRAMGHKQVAVLSGGLPLWLAQGYPCDEAYNRTSVAGDFVAQPQLNYFVDKKFVLENLNTDAVQVVDARSFARFSGQEKEPRKGMRSGHIPHSLNLHYASIIRDGQLLPNNELKSLFAALKPKPEQLIFSCGSGVTACILALAADMIGYTNIGVYDGSWSEWGKDKLLPIDSVT